MHIIITGASVTAIFGFLGWLVIYLLIFRVAHNVTAGTIKLFTRKKSLPVPEPVRVQAAKVTRVRTVKFEPAQPDVARGIRSKPSALVASIPAVLRRKTTPASDLPVRFYIHVNAEVKGPYTPEQIHALRDAGVVTPETQVCPEGTEDWQPSADVLPAWLMEDKPKRQSRWKNG